MATPLGYTKAGADAAIQAAITAALAVGTGINTTDIGSDVVLVAGQSNAVEFGVGKDATFLDTPDPRIRQWAISGTYAGSSILAVDSQMQARIVNSDPTRIGFAMQFARVYSRGIPENRHVLLVPAAQGGTGFTTTSVSPPPSGYALGTDGTASGTWDPTNADGGYSLYQAAIAKTNAAIAANPNNRLVAILWLQGEADGSLNQSQYAAKLDALITGFRSQITGAATVPFIVGQMVPDWQYFNPAINAAHVDTPRRQQRTAFTYGFSGMSNTSPSEPYHYNAAGLRAMGRALYDTIALAKVNVVGSAPIAPTAVTLTQDSATPSTLHTKWSRPLSRVTDYTVQYSTNSGSSWATVARAQSIEVTADITGLTVPASVQVRVAAVNETSTSAYSTIASINMTSGTATMTNTAAPAVSGTSRVGETMTTSNGTWSVTPDSYTYQWKRAGTSISGATAATYVPVIAEAGQAITCTVTTVKSGYAPASATTSSVTPPAFPLTDTFSSAFDTTKWPNSTSGAGIATNAGVLRVPCLNSYPGAISGDVFDLNSEPVTVGVISLPPVGDGTATAFLILRNSSNSKFASFEIANDSSRGTKLSVTNNADTNQADTYINFDATNMKYLRLRVSGSNLLWQTSPDKLVWNTQRTVATPTWITSTMRVILGAGYYGTLAAGNYAEFDDLNA